MLATWVGVDAEALIGRRFQDLLSIGSKLFLQTQWWPLIEMQGSVAEVQLELATTASGKTLPALVNAVRRPADRRIDVAVFVATDRRKYERELLLARRNAEELLEKLQLRELELRTLTENSPDLIARIDRDHRFSYVSRSSSLFDDHADHPQDASLLVGRALSELPLPSAIIAGLSTALTQALEGHSASFAFQREAKSSDDGGGRSGGGYGGGGGGSDVQTDFEARFVPERGSGASVSSVLVLVRDITAVREQEREARRRAILAEQLIGIVSHDLRNPLNAISLGSALLATVDLGAQASTARRISNAAARAIRLTAELLDFTEARLGGGIRVSPTSIDLHAVVAETVEELRLAWTGRMIEHRCEGGTRSIRADPDRLAQVVTNLVSNAMQYGTKECAVIVTTSVASATGSAELRVHNDGRPIPEELRDQIFEPLRRGDEQVRSGSRSVGLGLYIVREIAQAHGGHATLESTAETGTTFTVSFPP